jgi:hypothetical protein
MDVSWIGPAGIGSGPDGLEAVLALIVGLDPAAQIAVAAGPVSLIASSGIDALSVGVVGVDDHSGGRSPAIGPVDRPSQGQWVARLAGRRNPHRPGEIGEGKFQDRLAPLAPKEVGT